HHAAAGVGDRGTGRGLVDVVVERVGARVIAIVIGGVLFAVVAEAQQVFAQRPFEVGARLLAHVVALAHRGVGGAAQADARQRDVTVGGDRVALQVAEAAVERFAVVAAVHQLHRQVVGEIAGPGQRPVLAAGVGIDLVGLAADRVGGVVVVVDVADVLVLVGERHGAQQVAV